MTTYIIGTILAFIAMLGWGFGDFLIQKTTRQIGSWKSLFFIGIFAFIFLFPFIRGELSSLTKENILLLLFIGVIVLLTSLFDFEALRQGKIAIVEPIIGLELPLTVGLGMMLGGETLSTLQMVLIFVVFAGIVLSITNSKEDILTYHKRVFEKGAILAGIGAIGMATSNYLVGFSSNQISPLITIWFTHSFLAFACLIYFLVKGECKTLFSGFTTHPWGIIGQSVLDNVAWVAYASATIFIPISITTTISESYVALSVLLGIFISKEKLSWHQIIGIIMAIASVITLAFISGE